MESLSAIPLHLFVLTLFFVLSKAQDFDFFYFVQQWPGSYCDTKQSCCYPTTGKPAADFGIHGLWPNYNDGSYPSNCDPNNPFDASKYRTGYGCCLASPFDTGTKQCIMSMGSNHNHHHAQIKDLTHSMQTNWPTLACPSGNGLKFWSHEWTKHGTCSESALDQHGYFQAALGLKDKANLLQVLHDAGIEPDGGFYSLDSITSAIKDAIGYTPGIECNADEGGNTQLYQIYLCVDTSGSDLIECPVLPKGRCASRIEFPSF
ncbi:extracellular ribonuclease LE-like protein [Cinnamomum micranthum f. kanehirae]|uniref:Extracellular ribonuclease LE-like protein n=1 Tax=Cinnamomum micranthum f. kanehirae TaxID=337451 RepID=A0A3S3NAR2_9MAGN|nr:extracellular ribonuclease LE-like protein [Cinnamomum micranthum f. kanehirae]